MKTRFRTLLTQYITESVSTYESILKDIVTLKLVIKTHLLNYVICSTHDSGRNIWLYDAGCEVDKEDSSFRWATSSKLYYFTIVRSYWYIHDIQNLYSYYVDRNTGQQQDGDQDTSNQNTNSQNAQDYVILQYRWRLYCREHMQTIHYNN